MTGQGGNATASGLTAAMFTELWAALGGAQADGTGADGTGVRFSGPGALPSRFAVTDFAAATLGTLGAAVAELVSAAGGGRPGGGGQPAARHRVVQADAADGGRLGFPRRQRVHRRVRHP